MGKRPSRTTSHEASRGKKNPQISDFVLLARDKGNDHRSAKMGTCGRAQKGAVAWSIPGEIGTHVCSH